MSVSSNLKKSNMIRHPFSFYRSQGRKVSRQEEVAEAAVNRRPCDEADPK